MMHIQSNEIIASMKQSFIFGRLSEQACEQLVQIVEPRTQTYYAQEVVFNENDIVNAFGLVLQGSVFGCKYTYGGKETIEQLCRINHVFGIEFAASSSKQSFFRYVCVEDSKISFFDYQKLTEPCVPADIRQVISTSLIDLLSIRNRKSFERMEILEQDTIRGRVMLYLRVMEKRRGSSTFEICKTRNELAEYLSVNRSALSNELSKMKQDGLINFKQNRFTLL